MESSFFGILVGKRERKIEEMGVVLRLEVFLVFL